MTCYSNDHSRTPNPTRGSDTGGLLVLNGNQVRLLVRQPGRLKVCRIARNVARDWAKIDDQQAKSDRLLDCSVLLLRVMTLRTRWICNFASDFAKLLAGMRCCGPRVPVRGNNHLTNPPSSWQARDNDTLVIVFNSGSQNWNR